jgi:hypothetical protein
METVVDRELIQELLGGLGHGPLDIVLGLGILRLFRAWKRLVDLVLTPGLLLLVDKRLNGLLLGTFILLRGLEMLTTQLLLVDTKLMVTTNLQVHLGLMRTRVILLGLILCLGRLELFTGLVLLIDSRLDGLHLGTCILWHGL